MAFPITDPIISTTLIKEWLWAIVHSRDLNLFSRLIFFQETDLAVYLILFLPYSIPPSYTKTIDSTLDVIKKFR